MNRKPCRWAALLMLHDCKSASIGRRVLARMQESPAVTNARGLLQVATCSRMLHTATLTSALSLLRGDIIGSATYARCAANSGSRGNTLLMLSRTFTHVTPRKVAYETALMRFLKGMLTLKLVAGCKVDSRTRILPTSLAGTLGSRSAESEKRHRFSKVYGSYTGRWTCADDHHIIHVACSACCVIDLHKPEERQGGPPPS